MQRKFFAPVLALRLLGFLKWLLGSETLDSAPAAPRRGGYRKGVRRFFAFESLPLDPLPAARARTFRLRELLRSDDLSYESAPSNARRRSGLGELFKPENLPMDPPEAGGLIRPIARVILGSDTLPFDEPEDLTHGNDPRSSTTSSSSKPPFADGK